MVSKINFKKKRKEDALALAELVYDIFKEENDKIDNGQNDAKHTESS